MSFINIEIKARTNRSADIRNYLLENGAEFRGTDNQTDTYFNSAQGRLKLREGNIENSLIFYNRAETGGTKQSNVDMMEASDPSALRSILMKALGVLAVVSKRREIYFIGNVKFHLDSLEGLGEFVEIEAANRFEDIPVERLKAQCEQYMAAFGVREGDLVRKSYSDMVMEMQR